MVVFYCSSDFLAEQTVCQPAFSVILSAPDCHGVARLHKKTVFSRRFFNRVGNIPVLYFAYNLNFIEKVSPGAMLRKPEVSGSVAFGAFVTHDCGSGQQ